MAALSPAPGPAEETFLLLPGLNMAPAALAPWGDLLREAGHAARPVPLTGAAAPGDPAWRRVRAADWLADLDRAVAAAGTPWVSLVGYSLGAVLGAVWSLERRRPWHRAILLAPAFRLHGPVRALLALGVVLGPGGLVLPGCGPRRYRLHRGTSLAAYGALRELTGRFAARRGAGAAVGRAQLVICPRRDEFVSPAAAAEHALRSGSPLVWLDTARPRGIPRHLGLDACTLGAAEWARVTAAVTDWLGATAQVPRPATAASDTGGVP